MDQQSDSVAMMMIDFGDAYKNILRSLLNLDC